MRYAFSLSETLAILARLGVANEPDERDELL